jgi:type I restriction enzyme S subunit
MGREHLREGWHYGKLGDFITLQRGFDLPEYKRLPGKIPVVTSSGITGTHSHSKASGPGVVMGRYGTIGKLFFIKEDFWPHNTSLYVRDFKGNDPRFIFYFLKTMNYQSHNDKSSVPGLNRNHLHLADAIIPPLPIQRRIAHILGTLDDKIEQSRRMNATLEAIARALFRSWFVDFDPVRAKADGRDPPGMDTTTAALFPAAFEDSSLGKVPRGWRVGTVGDTISLSKDSLVPGDFPNEIFEHYSIPSFDEGRIPKQSKGEEIKSSKFIVTHQSVLLSRINPDRSRVWLPLENKERRSICSTEYLVVIPKKHTTKEYLYSLFCSRSFQEIFITMVTGTSSSHQRVKAEYFLSMEILEPPKAIIHAYTKIVTPMFERIAANLHHTRTLAALRDALLPKLLSGEVGVGGERNQEVV